jgi:hypothetical protein
MVQVHYRTLNLDMHFEYHYFDNFNYLLEH